MHQTVAQLHHTSVPYYSTYAATVATIIPVLFVALAVDLRTLKPRAGDIRHAALLLSIVVVLVAAEAVCLSSLARKTPIDDWGKFLIGGAFLWSAMLMLVRVVTPIYDVLKRSTLGQLMWTLFIWEGLVLLVLVVLRIVTWETLIVAPTLTLLTLTVSAVGTSETLQPLLQKTLRRWLPKAVPDEILCALVASKDKTCSDLSHRMNLAEDEIHRYLRRAVLLGYARVEVDGTVDNGEDMEWWRLTRAGKTRVKSMTDAGRSASDDETGEARRDSSHR